MSRNDYKGLIGWLIVVCFAEGVAAAIYEVGNSTGWTVPSNNSDFYSDWARSKTFHVGDELLFKWNGSHNVANASETEYETCTNTLILSNSSPTYISLTSTGNHYFICTVGTHCKNGQKLAVNVSNSNSASSMATGALLAVISSIVMYI